MGRKIRQWVIMIRLEYFNFRNLDYHLFIDNKHITKKILNYRICMIKRIHIFILNTLLFLFANNIYALNLDSLEQATLQMSATKEKVDNLVILGSKFINVDKRKNLKYNRQALELSGRLNYTAHIKQLYFYLGATLIAFDGDSADYYLDLALDLAKQTDDAYILAETYNAKGTLRDNNNERRKALLLYYKAEKYALKSNNLEILSNIYNNIGIALAYTSNKDAISYFKKAYYTAQREDLKNPRLRAMLNLGIAFRTDEQIDSSLVYLYEALELNKEVNNKYLLTNIYLALSTTYGQKKDFNTMKEYDLKGLEVSKKLNYQYGILMCYQNLQNSESKLGNYKKSIEYGEYILKRPKFLRNINHVKTIYEVQSNAYRQLGDYKNAMLYQDSILISKDSIHTLEQEERIKELEKEYKVGKLQAQQAAQAKQAKLERRILYAVLLLTVLVSFGAVRFYRTSKIKTKLSKQLEVQTAELERLDETKTRFFTNVSHELKTPLTLIINPIEKLLKRVNIDNESYFLLNTIKKHSYQLLDLTNQILELTKFDVNKEELNKTVVNPYELIELLVSEFDSLAESKGVKLIVINGLSDELFIRTDKYKLQTIIKNLISNAIKFTPKDGKIRIKTEIENDKIAICISDTGRGIPQNQVSKIFDRYYQVSTPNIISEGGTGIGLSICKEYVEALDGTIEVSSVWQEGTTFRVVLPIEKASETDIMVSEEPQLIALNTSLSKNNSTSDLPQILLVEDNSSMQEYLQHILATNFNIHIANNGQEALKYLENNQPQLIISDVMMPIMNGYQFLEACKKEPKWALIPFIMLTAVSATTEKLKFLRLGIDDYLLKPFVDEELIARIDNLLENATERKAYQRESNKSTEAVSTENELTTEHQLWLEEVEAIVKEKCVRFDFSVDMLAYDLSLSRSQTHRKIKSLTGLTPREYINNIRFEMARQLLQSQSSMTIKAVSFAVGFKDEKYFSRKFKKHFGKNPSEYVN